uniref:Uncharacterized protein n=1 Tax=viral metagenome TaxID=1070528 RepID=A0A6C0BUA3_9ZZZZ
MDRVLDNPAFEQLMNIQEGIVARGVERNLDIIETFIAISEQLCIYINNEIQNETIQNDNIQVYIDFINRYIRMFEGIVQNSNLTDEQKNRFRDPIENLKSTLNLLESNPNQGDRILLQGGKKITRNKKSRKGKKSRRKNRKSKKRV